MLLASPYTVNFLSQSHHTAVRYNNNYYWAAQYPASDLMSTKMSECAWDQSPVLWIHADKDGIRSSELSDRRHPPGISAIGRPPPRTWSRACLRDRTGRTVAGGQDSAHAEYRPWESPCRALVPAKNCKSRKEISERSGLPLAAGRGHPPPPDDPTVIGGAGARTDAADGTKSLMPPRRRASRCAGNIALMACPGRAVANVYACEPMLPMARED